MVFNLITASKPNPESKQTTDTGMGLLLVFFPEDETAAAAKRTVLSPPTHSTSAMMRRTNSSLLFSRAQSTISFCLLFLFLTLLLFTLSTFEPSAPTPAASRIPRRFLSQKPPSDSSNSLFAMWDSRGRSFSRREDDSRATFALQRMGTLFGRGTRAMNDLVVGHVVEDVSEDEFAIFLRILHRSGITAKADVVFLFGSSSLLSRFRPVIEEENRYFSKLLERYKQNPSSARDSALGFDVSQFLKSGKKEVAEPVWGKKARGDYSQSPGGEEDELTRLSYGSIVGFEVDELDPENSLAGFLDHVPMSLRRWACYPMLLGRLRRNFKHIMLLEVKNLVLVGDPLGRARNRRPESVLLFAGHGRKNSEVNPAVVMGGARGIRRLTNAMVTEIVRASMQRKKKSSLSESVILSQLVGSEFILKNVDVSASCESIPEASSLSGTRERKIIQLGNGNGKSRLRKQIQNSSLSFSLPSRKPEPPRGVSYFQEIPNFPSLESFTLMGKMSGSETKFLQELILYAASAALSCLVLFAGLRHLDPNRDAAKKALEHKKEIAKRLGRPLVQTTPYEDVIACDVINPDHIDVEFDSIGGLESIKQSLYELVILPLRRPELFSHGKLLGPQKGVLLYGPPGTGKTMLAKAIAKESGAVFINVRVSSLMSKWFGDAQKLVAAVFSLAYKLQPAIIFIDEVDSFLGQRRNTDHEAMANMKTEFMALWDGFTTDQNARVMVLAATNRPSELDEAILRRLPQAFEIGMPDRKERAAILKVTLRGEKVEENIDYDRVASLCEGYTGSDILELCKKAAYFPIRELLDEEKKGKKYGEPRPLSQADLEKILVTSKKTGVAANEYGNLSSWSIQRDSDEYPVQAVINEVSRLVVSQLVNLQSESRDREQ